MDTMKRTGVAIGLGVTALIVLVSVSYMVYTGATLSGRADAAYDSAYEESYTKSHHDGYRAGYEEQYPAGYDEGHKDGLADGSKRGYDEGHKDGLADGSKRGYDKGHKDGLVDGHKRGYQHGYSAGRTESHRRGYDDGYAYGMTAGQKRGYDEGYQDGIESGHSCGLTTHVDLHEPSYAEVIAFLGRDRTDLKPYIIGQYVCTNFSADVCNNAEAEGIRSALVFLEYAEEDAPGHAIIVFQTTDRGLVFIEPQSDNMANPVVGQRWYLCIVPSPGYFYLPPSYDDTIVDIRVIW